MRKHGKIELDDEQFNLVFELFYAFHTLEEKNIVKLVSSEEVQKFRKDICLGCSQFEEKTDWRTCKACGCDLDYKVTNPTESCPISKWSLDLEPIKQQLKSMIEYLNSQVDTNFYEQITVEENEYKYRQIVESGEKHE